MITAEEAYNIGKKYLEEKKRDYVYIFPLEKIEKLGFVKNYKILHGPKEGQYTDIWYIGHAVQWGSDLRSQAVLVDATSGEVLYTIGPHGPIEELEEQ